MQKFSGFLRRRLYLFVMAFVSSLAAAAQEQVAMADTMRSNGKIYIVVAVCLTILIGLFLYVLTIDRKINRLEKEKN